MGEVRKDALVEATPLTPTKNSPTTLQHTLASQCATTMSTLIIYPIDVVRTRFLSQDGTLQRQHNGQTYRSMWSSFKVIAQEEGYVRPFFRGFHISVLGSVCSWGVYMYLYRWQCALFESYRTAAVAASAEGGEAGSSSTAPFVSSAAGNLLQRFGFSIIASCLSAVICNPMWLLKTRMQIEESSRLTSSGERNFLTFRSGLVYTICTTGVRSLWRGASAQVILAVPNAFNLPIYDTVKTYMLSLSGCSNLSTAEVCVCSTVTKVAIAVIAHPILLIKTRLQDHRARVGDVKYTSLSQSVRTTVALGGVSGLYRGLVPSLCQTVPRSVLMFVFYEKFLQLFTSPRFSREK